ncbi:MAG TPA: alpha/beta hydrolase-fold protein [Bryobacteraceae bacterium]|nr:alpha/beta hydrolase-fold protein [Bryobacteraceae bacterium]
MNREYHKWFSPRLGRDMELLVFGHAGMPVIVFPTSMGRFFDYENRHMIEVVRDRYEQGRLQAFCVDSVDAESWYNKSAPPAQRAARHLQYDDYLVHELMPFIRTRNASPELAVTGCSFGGYHSVNFALRHPDLATYCVSMGGAFDIRQFLDGYYDDNCYYNCPPDFLPGLNDSWYLDRYRRMRIVLATGENDICLAENRRLSDIMTAKSIPHWLDVWGDGTGHDWPWWEQMAQKFF